MFLVVFVYVLWKPQHQNKFLVCASTLSNKALSDSDTRVRMTAFTLASFHANRNPVPN